MHANNPETI